MSNAREVPGHVSHGVRPSLWRRLASLLYEGVLLFGVLMAAGIAYSVLTEQRHALQGKLGLQVVVFLVLGLYFTWFWSHGGQTLAMKTWRLRVVRLDGQPLSALRAAVRYVLSWMWFLPGLAVATTSATKSTAALLGVIALGMAAYAALAWLRRDRRLWHDVVCGTCVVTWRARQQAVRGAGGPPGSTSIEIQP